MATEQQIAANRRNAQLSTGPRTEAGRNISRLNAYQHGLTGQIEVMTPEEKAIHDQFCTGIVGSLKPADPLESQFAQAIAEGHWRLNRARTIENNIFTLACSFQESSDDEAENPAVDKALAAARAFVSDPHRFQLLTIYEMRINRKLQSDLKQIKDLQAARRAQEATEKAEHEARRKQAFEEACLLVQLDESEGTPGGQALSPQRAGNDEGLWSAIGFVYPNAEIIAAIRFEHRLNAAKEAKRRTQSAIRRAA